MKDDNKVAVILEEVRGQYRAIDEGLQNLQGLPSKVDQIDQRLTRVESAVDIIKIAVRGHSRSLKEHHRRLIRLER